MEDLITQVMDTVMVDLITQVMDMVMVDLMNRQNHQQGLLDKWLGLMKTL
jgi:hypothetical protein